MQNGMDAKEHRRGSQNKRRRRRKRGNKNRVPEERNARLLKGSAFHFLNFNDTEKGLNFLRELICKDQD